MRGSEEDPWVGSAQMRRVSPFERKKKDPCVGSSEVEEDEDLVYKQANNNKRTK